jgi:hypothetical protein
MSISKIRAIELLDEKIELLSRLATNATYENLSFGLFLTSHENLQSSNN